MLKSCSQPGCNHRTEAMNIIRVLLLARWCALRDKCAMGKLLLYRSASDLTADSASLLT